METKITLINTPVRLAWDASFFPIGLAYIATFIERSGREIEILDFNLTRPTDGEAEEMLIKSKPRYVGITGMAIQYGLIRKYAHMAKQRLPGVTVIVGGRVTAVPELIMNNPDIDVAVMGDGEDTINELLTCLDKGDDLKKVRGIAYRDEKGEIVQNPLRSFEANLDRLGVPNYELFNVDQYIENQKKTHSHRGGVGKRSLNMISTRGCPFHCSFCGEDRDNLRRRSISGIIREIGWLKDRYNINHVHFSDGLFFNSRKRVHEFCDALDASGLGITWSGNGRVDIVTPELIDRVMKSGCNLIAYGFESGSPEMLKAMNKTTTVEQNMRTVQIHRERNLPFATSMILGARGENYKTLYQTWIFLMKTCFTPSSINYMMIYPGTPDWYYALSNGRITNLTKYMDRMAAEVSSARYSDKKLLVNISNLSDRQLYWAGVFVKYTLRLRLKLADYGIGSALRRFARVFTRKKTP